MHILQQQDIKRVKFLGEGAYGKVFYGKLRDRRYYENPIPISVAIKDIPLNFSVISKQDLLKKIQVFNKELELVKKFTNEFLINSYGYVFYDDRLSLVIEYCDGKALDDYLKCGPYRLTVKQKLHILRDIAKGIHSLHSIGIIHRDIKSMNILLKYLIKDENSEIIAKLADFGISQTVEEINLLSDGSFQNAGTPQWMSPEDLRDEKPSFKSDTYAFSIVIWEIFSEKIPYADNYSEDDEPLASYQIAYLVSNESLRPRIDLLQEDTPFEIMEFLQKCWHDEKDERPDFGEIIIFLEQLMEKY